MILFLPQKAVVVANKKPCLRDTWAVVPTKQWSHVLKVKIYLILIFHHIFGTFWILGKPLVFFQHFYFDAKEVYDFS